MPIRRVTSGPSHILGTLSELPWGGYLYILKIKDIYKIGRAKRDVVGRIQFAWIKAGKPDDFHIINCIPVEPEFEGSSFQRDERVEMAERGLHNRFWEKRISRKEHFRLSKDDLAYIKSIKEYRDGQFIFAD